MHQTQGGTAETQTLRRTRCSSAAGCPNAHSKVLAGNTAKRSSDDSLMSHVEHGSSTTGRFVASVFPQAPQTAAVQTRPHATGLRAVIACAAPSIREMFRCTLLRSGLLRAGSVSVRTKIVHDEKNTFCSHYLCVCSRSCYFSVHAVFSPRHTILFLCEGV